MGLGTGLVSGSGPEEEEEEEDEEKEEAGPVGLEARSVRRLDTPGASIPPPRVLRHCSYPDSGVRAWQPPPSRDRRLLLPSSEEGFLRSRRPPAAASSMSPSSIRRAL